MSKIKVMSTALSNRIAAGEVIERPASVVKELVENAIDAGSSFITVEVERAGSRLIAVTDDGCGMDQDDARLSLEQHGTSKLLSEADLEHIMTLGFRGEALPSIASVSCFTLKTRQSDAEGGSEVFCNEDGELHQKPYGGPPGTRIEVRELFCNLPARKKFLKSPATEEHHIEEMVAVMAIGHPEIGFKLLLDNRMVLHTPGSGKIEYRLREIFGKKFVDNMLFFEHTENELRLSGCIAAPGFTRPSRKEQKVFINSRPVEAQAVYRGIRDGYGALAESGRYNPVVIFLDMPPEQLDVNVHPAKREVRFKSEYAVSRAVAAAVSGALRQTRTPENIPDIREKELPLSGKLPLSLILDSASISYTPPSAVQDDLPVMPPETTFAELEQCNPLPLLPPPENIEIPPPEIPQTAAAEDGNGLSPLVREVRPAAFTGNWPSRIIGAVDNTYILAESSTGLVLIDQHAAHERIMFENILAAANAGNAASQALLIPETVELPLPMVRLLTGNSDVFARLGFEVESAGGTAVIVTAVPQAAKSHRPVAEWLCDMLTELLENSGGIPGSVAPEYAARAACKAAVKAHDELTLPEMEKLLAMLRNCRQGTLCPHGRPTIIDISLKEIERRFGRR